MSYQAKVQPSIQSSYHAPLGLQLAVAIFCRFLLKTGRRFVYPFAATVSGALGVSLAAITMLLALNQVAALLSPIFGQLSDRWGYRTMLAWGLAVASLAMLAVGLLPTYAGLLVALLAIGIGISICDPALHAYVGMKVPFAKRGKAMGMAELAWAASSLVGIPVAGWLVHSYSWNTPFALMGALGLAGTFLLRWLLPCDQPCRAAIAATLPMRAMHMGTVQMRTVQMGVNYLGNVLPACRALVQDPTARAMLVYAFLISCASDIFFVTYALWLADGFSMGVVAIGVATIAVGVAELSGELLTATLADRLGLRRTVLATLLATAGCYALLSVWGASSIGTLVGIFALCLMAEFNLVATMSLCTEVRPNARATMMSSFQAASGMGHVVGVLVGSTIWFAGGMMGVGLVCAGLCGLAFVTMRWGLARWRRDTATISRARMVNATLPQLHAPVDTVTPVQLPIWYHQILN